MRRIAGKENLIVSDRIFGLGFLMPLVALLDPPPRLELTSLPPKVRVLPGTGVNN